MISALLGLMFHQHDCGDHHNDDQGSDSQEQCPATAWHTGAVQAAALPVTVPAPAQAVAASVQTFVSAVSEADPRSFLPRGPPSVPSI